MVGTGSWCAWATAAFLVTAWAAGPALGEGVDGAALVGVPAPAAWTVEPEDGADAMAFVVRCPGFTLEPFEQGTIPRIVGQVAPPEPGLPELPAVAKSFPGRVGRNARVRVEPPAWVTITNVMIPPVARIVMEPAGTNGVRREVRREPSAEAYGRDAYWPPPLAQVHEALMGTQAFVRVQCNLLQYNPFRRTLRYCTEMRGWIEFGDQKDVPPAP